jgi:anaerobic ribonucleoside-triphosphate reductase activating protein
MKETTWIIDAYSGDLTVEGLQHVELKDMTADLLPSGKPVNCARPIDVEPLRIQQIHSEFAEPSLRVFRIYHNSVVEGPGRRSVVQTAGCLLRCPGCHSVETHPMDGGVEMKVSEIVEKLLAPEGAPRDGVTILGGEPFLQPNGLRALLQTLKRQGQHVTLYTGYRLEQLIARSDPVINHALELSDTLIDGPFVKDLSNDAGEFRGSTNQRIIHRPMLQHLTGNWAG